RQDPQPPAANLHFAFSSSPFGPAARLGRRQYSLGPKTSSLHCHAGTWIDFGHPPRAYVNQTGSRYRRSRTVTARNTAAIANPIHSPALNTNGPSLRWLSGSIESLARLYEALSAPPANRCSSIPPKYDVPNAIFSTKPIASGGKTAQRN